jgi:hypothetical protein
MLPVSSMQWIHTPVFLPLHCYAVDEMFLEMTSRESLLESRSESPDDDIDMKRKTKTSIWNVNVYTKLI